MVSKFYGSQYKTACIFEALVWQEFYHIILGLLVYVGIGVLVSWFYYYYRRKALLGGFLGGIFIGGVGAVIVTWFATIYDWFATAVVWLMIPKINGEFYFRVNIITAVIGAFLFISILNRINHNRDRQ